MGGMGSHLGEAWRRSPADPSAILPPRLGRDRHDTRDLATQIPSQALGMVRQLKVPNLGIMESVSAFVCPQGGTVPPVLRVGGAHKTSRRRPVPCVGELPLDPSVCQTGDRREPILGMYPEAPAAGVLRSLEARLGQRLKDEAFAAPRIRMG
jgi:ATP-binding protein involved in chromosome partitioning